MLKRKGMGKTVKTGISFPKDLLETFDRVVEELNLGSRSTGMQEAVRTFISMNVWKLRGPERIAGAILVHYTHESGDVEKNLTEIQHHFIDVIPSALHVHLTEKDCLLIVAVKGDKKRVKELAEELRKAGKMKQVTPLLTTIC